MTAPAFGAIESGNASSATSVTVNVPSSTQDGDLLLAFCANDTTAQFLQEGGWHRMHTETTTSVGAAWFWRTADNEPASYTFDHSGSAGGVAACIMRVTGASQPELTSWWAEPYSTGTGVPDPGPASLPSGSGATDCLVVTAFCSRIGRVTSSTPPTNYTERLDLWTNAGLTVATREMTSITSENPGTFSLSSTEQGIAFTVLVPEASVDYIEPGTTTASNGASTTVTPTIPPRTTDGDLLLAICGSGAGPSHFSATGWTHVSHSDFTSTSLCVLHKTASSEGSTVTFTHSGESDDLTAIVMRITGSYLNTPQVTFAESTFAGSPNPPDSASLDYGDHLVIAAGALDNSTASWAFNPISSMGWEMATAQVAAGSQTFASALIYTKTNGTVDPGTFATDNDSWAAATIVITGQTVTLTYIAPDADTTTTGWSSTPLWSKIDDDPDSPDATVITGTAS